MAEAAVVAAVVEGTCRSIRPGDEDRLGVFVNFLYLFFGRDLP